jgi:uncharacterized protein Smg (DUF494 family)
VEITKEMLDYLDERYVKKDACNDRHVELAKELSEVSINQAKIVTDLATIKRINAAELGAVATAIIAAIMNTILK